MHCYIYYVMLKYHFNNVGTQNLIQNKKKQQTHKKATKNKVKQPLVTRKF